MEYTLAIQITFILNCPVKTLIWWVWEKPLTKAWWKPYLHCAEGIRRNWSPTKYTSMWSKENRFLVMCGRRIRSRVESNTDSNTSSNATNSDNELGSLHQPPVSKLKELRQKLLEVQTSMDDNKKKIYMQCIKFRDTNGVRFKTVSQMMLTMMWMTLLNIASFNIVVMICGTFQAAWCWNGRHRIHFLWTVLPRSNHIWEKI